MHIPKHNLFIIGGDLNAHIGPESGYKYTFITLQTGMEKLSRTSIKQYDMSKHSLSEYKWSIIHNSQNEFKSQINFIIINRKWNNSVKTAELKIRLMVLHLIIES